MCFRSLIFPARPWKKIRHLRASADATPPMPVRPRLRRAQSTRPASLKAPQCSGRSGSQPRSPPFSVDPSALAVAAVSERRVAEGRALYTKRSPAELYRGARSSARERYARLRGPRKFALANFSGEPESRLGAERGLPRPCHVRLLRPFGPRNDGIESLSAVLRWKSPL